MKRDYIKKGFTLVEVLVSITILAILFTFLSKTINTTKNQNKPYLKKATKIYQESKVFKLLINDFSQVIGAASIIYGKRFDIVRMQTKNSIHNIIEPYVTYFISKKELALIRTESLVKYDLFRRKNIERVFIYGDKLSVNTKSFKVYFGNDFYNIMLRVKEMNPIVLKLEKVK